MWVLIKQCQAVAEVLKHSGVMHCTLHYNKWVQQVIREKRNKGQKQETAGKDEYCQKAQTGVYLYPAAPLEGVCALPRTQSACKESTAQYGITPAIKGNKRVRRVTHADGS